MAQRSKQPVSHDSGRRLRRVHTKSRSGCSNCRFRRVKCDETKPSCQRCQNYMVSCSYSRDIVDLDTMYERTASSISFVPSDKSLQSTAPKNVTWRQTTVPFVLSVDRDSLTLLRFRNRTVFTLGIAHMVNIYAKVVPELALQHEHLFHAVLATTMFHDRALACSLQPLVTESYHLGQAAALFNEKLSTTISNKDRDALWLTAVYLCAMACFNVDSTNPEEVYPLRPSSSTDLEWLRMQAGLRAVWLVADLHGSNSILGQVEVDAEDNCVFPKVAPSGIAGLLPELVQLCDLVPSTNGLNNPYHTAVSHLSWMLKLNGTPANTIRFMIFAGGMAAEFKILLRRKDPRALLLLALWYSKLVKSTWWMSPRATVESEAIFRYLHRFHAEETQVLELLDSKYLGTECRG